LVDLSGLLLQARKALYCITVGSTLNSDSVTFHTNKGSATIISQAQCDKKACQQLGCRPLHIVPHHLIKLTLQAEPLRIVRWYIRGIRILTRSKILGLGSFFAGSVLVTDERPGTPITQENNRSKPSTGQQTLTSDLPILVREHSPTIPAQWTSCASRRFSVSANPINRTH